MLGRHFSRLALSLSLAPAALSAAPQNSDQPYDFDWDYAPTGFIDVEIGEFDGDGAADVIVVAEDRLVSYAGPAILDFANELPLSGEDAVTLRLGAPSGADALLVVNDDGLVKTWLGPSTSVPGTLEWRSQIIGPTGWEDVVRLHADDFGGFPEHDVVGLEDDLRTFVTFLQDAAGNWSFFPSFSAPYDLPEKEFTLLDCDADGILDVACLTTFGLQIVRYDGTVIWEVAHAYADGRLAIFEEMGAQRLAWVRRTNGAGDQELVVFDPDGTAETAVALGPLGVVSVSAGDVDEDDRDELFLTDTSSHDATVLFNGSTGATTFDYDLTNSNATFVFGYGGSGPHLSNQVSPAVFDFDGDEVADLVMPVEDAQRVRYQGGGLIVSSTPANGPVSVLGYEIVGQDVWLELEYMAGAGVTGTDCIVVKALRSEGSSVNQIAIDDCTAEQPDPWSEPVQFWLDLGPLEDVPTEGDYKFNLWTALGTFTNEPNYNATLGALKRLYQYQFTLTGECDTWGDGFPSCATVTLDEEIKGIGGDVDGDVVGVFSSSDRITTFERDLPWPQPQFCPEGAE